MRCTRSASPIYSAWRAAIRLVAMARLQYIVNVSRSCYIEYALSIPSGIIFGPVTHLNLPALVPLYALAGARTNLLFHRLSVSPFQKVETIEVARKDSKVLPRYRSAVAISYQ